MAMLTSLCFGDFKVASHLTIPPMSGIIMYNLDYTEEAQRKVGCNPHFENQSSSLGLGPVLPFPLDPSSFVFGLIL